ncbi:pyridoxal phosphate-dependent aminotransferase [Verminephrobacter aporrectodeae subsp. tuberculatae]|uniref:Pyridoxal phosphate-dependent aminotransferase n=1 Tax=Verminephrobacter aporrectodeae subsp. tuberculatae TaxID=1110392 RepID=A0ABT3KYQ7_9BURK|nr:pyridoxal phosphate-dependent aminotransferase [Verminephrobacter aporrectodeae]MCW5219705.1 pyridoxal phosphate-dependent aminotransferase [Verminephrobacter aporrectodeae subsp. tuberculatae]MCW5287597.1 pyridoxal phosphate-dependent aminotransferase [Verminephrobacter aporrectodeae subsp. tuberculatae]MCW5323468.1 pyridoxal phosphate-dependent aminotransferase [Verminephrobacter aporrectodeae subsp. tuberculatae]MCW8203794.1 pyridoxal phosphate-dependent aminotransferase [Verminephrobacte
MTPAADTAHTAHTAAPPRLVSRLPQVGTTIFTVMSALAAEHRAVNLGQGFPDFACDRALPDAVTRAMQAGHNQYPPMPGIPALRAAVADKIEALHGRRYSADTEITITAGATQAILTALLAIVHPGDEVIVLDPCYDSYVPNIDLAGGRAVRVPLAPGSFRPDFARIGAAITPRTRAIITNSPHNPGATVWSAAEMRQLEDLLAPTAVVLISDEVYEHMVFDGAEHQSAARFAGLAARAFIVSSFGKTFHVTGWKVGSVAAPAQFTAEFRKVHQFNVFTVNTPMQHGLAEYLQDPAPYLQLPAFYQAKRDLFREGLAGSRLRLLPSAGSYFQCVDISAVSERSESDFCQWLTREIGVAAIPLSAFYGDGFEQRVVRFCFAKKEATLRAALERLRRL